MSASSVVTEKCPYVAKYITSINKSTVDDLNKGEILISPNCNYILIRQPSSYLSFYSIKDETIIHKWSINDNNSIWSINNNFQNAQSLSISNSGCLSFINTNQQPFSTICNTQSSNIISQQSSENINLSSLGHTASSNINIKNPPLLSLNGSGFDENLALIISSILIQIFVVIFFFIIFALCYRCKCKKHKYEFIEIPGGGNPKSIEMSAGKPKFTKKSTVEINELAKLEPMGIQLSQEPSNRRDSARLPDDTIVQLRILSLASDERQALMIPSLELEDSLSPIDDEIHKQINPKYQVTPHIKEILGKDTKTLENKLSIIHSVSDCDYNDEDNIIDESRETV